MSKIKVLSLDGGGIKGYLTILILEKIEKILNKKFNEDITIGERFDLIAGTSTGAIIASSLAVGNSAKYTRELYEKLINKIFTPISKGINKPKYSQDILKKELEKVFKNKTLQDVKTHLLITSTDASSAKAVMHKSPYQERFFSRSDELLVDVILASTAAPTYFPLVDTKYYSYLADGALVANNPAMVALIDAIELANGDLKSVKLLSVGTGEDVEQAYDVEKIKESGGVYSWASNKDISDIVFMKNKFAMPILEIFMNAQSKLVHSQLSYLLKSNYFRINPNLTTDIEIDDIEKLPLLKNSATVADRGDIINRVIKLLTK